MRTLLISIALLIIPFLSDADPKKKVAQVGDLISYKLKKIGEYKDTVKLSRKKDTVITVNVYDTLGWYQVSRCHGRQDYIEYRKDTFVVSELLEESTPVTASKPTKKAKKRGMTETVYTFQLTNISTDWNIKIHTKHHLFVGEHVKVLKAEIYMVGGSSCEKDTQYFYWKKVYGVP